MSLLGRFIGGNGDDMERRALQSSYFVPPPSMGVIDDFVGVHRAMANMTVFACVRLLADTIASLPWKAYRRDSKGVPQEINPQPALINQPFPGFDLFQWKWMMVASMALRGNAYSYITARDRQGYPTSILPLHPDLVFLERRPDILMWFDPIYRIMGEAVPKEDVIHMRRFTMPGEPWGMSPIRQAAVAINLGLSAEEYGLRFYKDSATPSGTLMTDQDVDPETLTNIQKNWIKSNGGRRLPAVLSKGFKFEPISLRPDESQFLECVARGTLVTLEDGSRIPVEELRVDDAVMSWDGSKLVSSRVKAVGKPPVKQMVKVTTARGRELTCTADHPILGLKHLRTPGGRPLPTDGEWIKAGDLEPGNYVRIAQGSLPAGHDDLSKDIAFEFDSVKEIERLGPGQSIGVEIEDTHTFVTNGIITHNTRQFQRSEICLLFGVPPILVGDTKECVVAGTFMTMADGSRKVVEDLHVNDRVTAWDGSKLVASRVKWVGTPPVKPIVKVTTVRGRELTCTADHPILGLKRLRTPGNRTLPMDGEWLYAGDLEPGQYVRIGMGHVPGETGNLSKEIGYFLGSMVGDGHIRLTQKHQSRWSNTNDDVIARMSDVVESLGGRLVYRGHRTFDLLNAGYTSVIGGILQQSELIGTHALDKFVPDMVMKGGAEAWKGFLSGYFDADGCISTTAAYPHAHFGSASRELLLGCQHLLALLGINSSIYLSSKAQYRSVPRGRMADCLDAWQLRIKGRGELAKLSDILDVSHPDKRAKLANLGITHGGIGAEQRSIVFEYDKVKNVEDIGPGQSVGIEIEGTHTHITNGIISHNTTAWGTGVEQITLGAVTYTFRPWTSCIESVISACLPRGQFVRFDYNALLRGDMAGRYGALSAAISGAFMTPNEARASEEMDPVDGGDELFVVKGTLPLSTAVSVAMDGGGVNDGEDGPAPKPKPKPAPKTPGSGTLPMPPTGGGERSNGDSDENGDMIAKYLKEKRVSSLSDGNVDAMLNGVRTDMPNTDVRNDGAESGND